MGDEFKSERISKTASFLVNAEIEKAFKMFDAFEERKWAEGWNPEVVYPEKEIIEEGTTFKTTGHGHSSEDEFLWIVTKFNKELHLIQYLVSTHNRFWTITVICETTQNTDQTMASVTYTFTGLNEDGNRLNKIHLEKMYKDNLADWANAINEYFANSI